VIDQLRDDPGILRVLLDLRGVLSVDLLRDRGALLLGADLPRLYTLPLDYETGSGSSCGAHRS